MSQLVDDWILDKIHQLVNDGICDMEERKEM